VCTSLKADSHRGTARSSRLPSPIVRKRSETKYTASFPRLTARQPRTRPTKGKRKNWQSLARLYARPALHHRTTARAPALGATRSHIAPSTPPPHCNSKDMTTDAQRRRTDICSTPPRSRTKRVPVDKLRGTQTYPSPTNAPQASLASARVRATQADACSCTPTQRHARLTACRHGVRTCTRASRASTPTPPRIATAPAGNTVCQDRNPSVSVSEHRVK
jgi:hypothetical protein